jgi:3-oxoacyl-[acyl-carrier protein] reductase
VSFFYRDNEAAANEVLEDARSRGFTITAAKVDVRDPQQCEQAVQTVMEEAGGIDILVNNAGITRDGLLAALAPEDVLAVLETNVNGVFNILRPVLPFMISRRSGKVINISSVAGSLGGRGQSNYAASKGAINALTRALAVELAARKITVNCVAPGVIETEMSATIREQAPEEVKSRILLRRFGKPEEVANAVWFLASQYADYITGQILHVDGGFKME